MDEDVVTQAEALLSLRDQILTSNNKNELTSYRDECKKMVSGLNTLKKAIVDKAQEHRRIAQELEREARDYADLSQDLNYCASRAREATWDLHQERQDSGI